MISQENIKDFLKNGKNYVPMIGATIGLLATAVAVTAIFNPTMFGLLGVGFIAAAGFTPALLGVIAVFSTMIFAMLINQMVQNHAISNNKGEKGKPGKDGKDADFADLCKDIIKSGEVTEENGNLHLILSKDDYSLLTSGEDEGQEVTLLVSSENKKVIKVIFKHTTPSSDDNTGKHTVQLTKVDTQDDLNEMKKGLGMESNNTLNVKVAPCTKSSVDNALASHALLQIEPGKNCL